MYPERGKDVRKGSFLSGGGGEKMLGGPVMHSSKLHLVDP